MRKSGFTLMELIVVVAIVAIVLSIAIPLYNRWISRESVVRDVKRMFAELSYIRLKSFTTKNEYSLCWDNNPFSKVTVNSDGSPIATVSFKHLLYASMSAGYKCVDFSTDGIADHVGSIRIYGDSYGAYVDCVAISRVRIDLGKWNEATGKCEVQ